MSVVGIESTIECKGFWYQGRFVPGFPRYFICANGRLFSKSGRGGTWKPRKPALNDGLRPNGKPRTPYYYVVLSNQGKTKQLGLHQIILLAFVGPCPPGMECRHLNGDSLDNRLGNLEYGTPAQNAEDQIRNGASARGEGSGRAIFTNRQVAQIFRMLEKDCTYSEIARRFGTGKTTIQGIAQRQNWRYFETDFKPQGRRLGERRINAKLTEADVREIRRLSRRGKSQTKLAEMFNVNGGTINCVIHRRTWKHVA